MTVALCVLWQLNNPLRSPELIAFAQLCCSTSPSHLHICVYSLPPSFLPPSSIRPSLPTSICPSPLPPFIPSSIPSPSLLPPSLLPPSLPPSSLPTQLDSSHREVLSRRTTEALYLQGRLRRAQISLDSTRVRTTTRRERWWYKCMLFSITYIWMHSLPLSLPPLLSPPLPPSLPHLLTDS